MEISIRQVENCDHASTRKLVDDAFRPEDVATFLDALRADGCILQEWLAEDSSGPVGHIVFSRTWVVHSDGAQTKAAMLTPLAVRPDRRRLGIGLRLMGHALAELEARGEALFLVLGHPDYYPRAGFSASLAQQIESPWPGNPAFMAKGALAYEGRLVMPAAISGAH